MKKTTHSSKTTMMLLSALYMLLGIPLIIWPKQTALTICYILGAVCALIGLVRVIQYFSKSDDESKNAFSLIFGVVLLILGVALLFAAESILKIFAIFIGIVVIVHSVLRLQLALNMKRANSYSQWQLLLILAVVMFAVGILLVLNPFTLYTTAVVIAGIALFLDGAMDMYGMIKASKSL